MNNLEHHKSLFKFLCVTFVFLRVTFVFLRGKIIDPRQY